MGPSSDPAEVHPPRVPDVDESDDRGAAWRESAVRTALHAYESAHGNAIEDPRRGLRWAARPRLVAAAGGALALVALAAWLLGPSAARSTVSAPASTAAETMSAAATPTASGSVGGGDVGGVTVIVHVAGEVQSPGLVELPDGARVADAVDAAGGATKDAELDAVNLARAVHDGEQILVPAQGAATAGASVGTPGEAPAVSLSTASAQELESLPGIGPVLAGRIVADREANGPFATVSSLARVSGVGDVLVAGLDGLAVP